MKENFIHGKLYRYTGKSVLFKGVWEVTAISDKGVNFLRNDGISIHVFDSKVLKEFELFTPIRIKWKTKYLGVVQ